MQPKNLGWKFAFVALLVALGAYSLWAKGLRQGIDLKGGYVLTFEVVTVEQERAALQAQIQAVKKQLDSAGAETKDSLTKQLAALKERLDDLPRREDSGALVQRVIDQLKKRVDPLGVYSLEWRKVGANRFQVRMPLGSAAAHEAKTVFRRAFAELERSNLRRSQIRRVVSLAGEARAEAIKTFTAGDDARGQALAEVAQAHDALQVARAALEKARTGVVNVKDLDKARADYRDANFAYERRLKDLTALNVNTEQLGRALDLYVTKREAEKLPADQVRQQRENLAMQLKKLRDKHPARREMIDAVVARYESWAEQRSGLDDPADLKRLVAKAGVLEFRIAPTIPDSRREPSLTRDRHDAYLGELSDHGPLPGRNRNDEYQWFELRRKIERLAGDMVVGTYAGKKYVLLCNSPDLTMLHDRKKRSWALTDAFPDRDQQGRRGVGFMFDGRGAARFALLTGNNVKKLMAILLDDEVYSAPSINEAIHKRGTITGDFSPREVGELVRTLNAGSLEGRVNSDPVSEKAIAPSMGRDNRQAGIRAAIYGLIGVAAFMMLYYLAAGGIANVALMLNLILVLAAMSFIDAVFTVPGIAGLILTIGMAVDANVLIFERLREEQAKTQSMRMAIRNAYSRAATAILDGNITTLLTCLILGWVGTEEVRGFAITLALGVMFSLFTSLAVTRWVFQLLVELGWVKSRVRMLAFIGTPKINWLAKRRIFWAASALAMALGLVALGSQGRDILGLELSSGTQASFKFKKGATIPGPGGSRQPPERGLIEAALREKALEMSREAKVEPGATSDAGTAEGAVKSAALLDRRGALGKLAETAKVITILSANKSVAVLEAFDADSNRQINLTEWTAGKGAKEIFASVDASKDGQLDAAELDARMPEWTYEVSTTVADVGLVRDVVERTFKDALDIRSSVKIRGDDVQQAGAVPGLGITLRAEDEGKAPITSELVEKRLSPEFRDRFIDYVGGVMFVVRDAAPALTEKEFAERIQTMRGQPDFAKFQFNAAEAIGLEPVGDGRFKSFAQVVSNPDVDYVGQRLRWQNFADNELRLLREALARKESLESVSEVDPVVAGKTVQRAVVAFVVSWLAIIAYLWIRFGSARWGMAAVLCLIHDVIVAVGMVALTAYVYDNAIGRMLALEPFKIDMVMVAAFLTIIGYSVNDTIVVFDRIRENRGKLTTVDETIINRSVNQTISRTLLTTTTTLIAVVVMYVFGGAGVHAFTFALLVGIVFGTYSSIAIASPLLLGFKEAIVGQVTRTTEGAPGK